MQLGDWLQRLGGESGVPTSESLFHKNYYALYFVLNIRRVPYGTLKVIWQHFGAKQHAHTHTHAVVEHTQWDNSTHTSISNSEHMCKNVQSCAHPHPSSHFSFLLALCSYLLFPPLFWIQIRAKSPTPRPPTTTTPDSKQEGAWSKYLMEKKRS